MRLKRFFSALLCVCMLSCSDMESSANVRYFSKIAGIISPYMDYNPRGELKIINIPSYYRVVYNKENRISEISFYKLGNKSNESYFGTHVVKYNYNETKLVRQYFDTKGNKSNMSRHYYSGGSIHIEEFDLNASGYKERLILKDSTMSRVETGLGTYEYKWTTINSKEFIQRQYKKNGISNYLTAYFPIHKSRIEIDNRGYLLSISNLDTLTNGLSMHEAAGYAEVIFDYDSYGNERGWRFYDIEGNLSNRKPFAVMEYGYAQCLYDFTFIDEKLGLYGSFSMSFYDANNDPVENNFNIHKTHFSLNKNDDIEAVTYYNKILQNQLHPQLGYHKITIQNSSGRDSPIVRKYDENNSIIE